MPERPSLRIATVGFQGFGNVGDEAILSGIEAALGKRVRPLAVFSGPLPATIEAFPDAPRIVTARHLPGPGALGVLRRADLLLLAGGGLFNDHWTGVIPRYTAWVLAARLAGARVAWAGVGVGPIRRGWLRRLARFAAGRSQLVLVRDEESAALLDGAGHPAITSDPAYFNELPAPGTANGDGELCLVVREPIAADRGLTPRLLGALAEVGSDAARDRHRPVVLTMGGTRDDAFARSVRDAIRDRGVPDAGCEPIRASPEAAMSRLAGASAVVTVRLHGLILAALAGVPTVPIAYDAKVRAAAERLGIGDLVVPLEAVSGRVLGERLDAARDEERRATVREHVIAMRAPRDDFADRILRMA